MRCVRGKYDKGLRLLVLAVLLLGGCGPARRKDDSIVVARVDGYPITATLLQEEMRRQGMTPASQLEDQYNKSVALDTLLTNLLVRREVETLDLSRDFVLQKALRQTLLQLAAQIYADEVIVPRVSPTQDDVDRYRREHPEQFTVRKTIVDPQQIMLMADLKDPGYKEPSPEYVGRTAQAIIEDLYRRLLAGEDFDTLAAYYSQDTFSRVRGGRLGWRYYDSTRVSPWMDSLFSFPVGRIMPPFSSEKAYFVVRINGRHEAGEVLVPDDSTRRAVAQYIGRERTQALSKQFIDSILAAGTLEVFDSTLAVPSPQLPVDLPLAVSNGTDTIFAGEFAAHTALFPAADGSRTLKEEDKRRLLGELHRMHTVWKAMKDLGYLNRPNVVRTRDEFLRDAGEARVRAGATDQRYTPTEEEIAACSAEGQAESGKDRSMHVQHILVDSADTAGAIKRAIDQGADFIEFARRYYRGDPELRDITYDLGFISAKDMPEEFYAAAAALTVGQVSDPVRTQWGYHIIRLVEKQEGKSPSEARETIVARLRKRHEVDMFRKWRQDLLARHHVVIDQPVLALVPILPTLPADSSAADTSGSRKP